MVFQQRGNKKNTHDVVGVLALLIEHLVRVYHVVHDVGLADLLRAELLRCREVPAVVVSEVVVRHDRRRLDPGAHLTVQEKREREARDR